MQNAQTASWAIWSDIRYRSHHSGIGGPKKDFIEKRIGKDLEKVIQEKTSKVVLKKERSVR
jgi:hypothetical protein